jgi:hypothetical protein
VNDPTDFKTPEAMRRAIDHMKYRIFLTEGALDHLRKTAEPEIWNREMLALGARGLVWAADTTFEALARRAPLAAAAYGFLSRFLPAAIHEHDLSNAFLQGLGGAAAMFIESRGLRTNGVGEVIAKEMAKSFSEKAPGLIHQIRQIRATSFADFTRQAEPMVAEFCKEVASSVVGEVLTSRLPMLAHDGEVGKELDELRKVMTKEHFKELVDKFVENALQDGIRVVMDEVYKTLESEQHHP